MTDVCPDHAALPAAGAGSPTAIIPITGARTGIRGYSDCQRLLVGRGSRFGPVATVVVADGSQPQGANAMIYSPEGTYSPLGVVQGINCIYMDASDPSRAWIRGVGMKEDGCAEPLGSHLGESTALELHRFPALDASGISPPVVARWDWDDSRAEHYIGFTCGNDWCEAGRVGFASSPTAGATIQVQWATVSVVADAPSLDVGRVLSMKGWYDQQRLAEPDGNGGLIPGKVIGTIIPHPALDGLDSRAPFETGWVPASYIHLDGPSPTYKRKLNLDAGINITFLRYGDAIEFVPEGLLPDGCAKQVGWWAKLQSANGDLAYRCIAFEPHPGVDIPGVARWRWLDEDETTWQRCASGCCPTS